MDETDLEICVAKICSNCKFFASKHGYSGKRVNGYCLALLSEGEQNLSKAIWETSQSAQKIDKYHEKYHEFIPFGEWFMWQKSSQFMTIFPWQVFEDETVARVAYDGIVRTIIQREAWLERQGHRFVNKNRNTCDGWTTKRKSK